MSPDKLPIGIQSFTKIRTEGYVYVDKTQYIASLFNQGSYFFLSRPRRFGKSLLVDTLDCALSGKKELFNGLYLSQSEVGWDFDTLYPIMRIDFSGSAIRSTMDLGLWLDRLLTRWEVRFGTQKTEGSPGERLISLIIQIAENSGNQVVILIDEYDKPILDNLNDPDLATRMRDILRDFYGAIKPLDASLKFVFLTGVSKFAKAGIFSGLNNLNDLTMDRSYSPICGYTEQDLSRTFRSWMSAFNPDDVKRRYNGYSWTGESVYNL